LEKTDPRHCCQWGRSNSYVTATDPVRHVGEGIVGVVETVAEAGGALLPAAPVDLLRLLLLLQYPPTSPTTLTSCQHPTTEEPKKNLEPFIFLTDPDPELWIRVLDLINLQIRIKILPYQAYLRPLKKISCQKGRKSSKFRNY